MGRSSKKPGVALKSQLASNDGQSSPSSPKKENQIRDGFSRLDSSSWLLNGQRWIRQEGEVVPSTGKGPEVFDIADDDEADEADFYVSDSASKGKATAFEIRRALMVTIVLIIAIGVHSLLVWQWMAQQAAESSRLSDRDATPEPSPSEPIVQWRGLKPVCLAERYVALPGKDVRLRRDVDMSSPAVGRIPEGTVVARTGECQNQAGLVRMPVLAAPSDGTEALEGWVTLTAEFLQGPRFLEPVI